MNKGAVKTTIVSSKGQIVIPEEIRADLKIKKGTKLVVIEKGNAIILKKEADILDSLGDIKEFSEYSLRDIWGPESEDIWNAYLKLKNKA